MIMVHLKLLNNKNKMKLFKGTPKKSFSVNIKEQRNGILRLSLVDSQTGDLLAHLCEITDDGIYLSKSVSHCMEDEGYTYNENMFEDNGSLKIKTIL